MNFLDAIKMGSAAALAALIVWHIAIPIGENRGYAKYRVKQEQANYEAELERMRDNETLADTSVYDICVADLRGRGLPVDQCEPLRGL